MMELTINDIVYSFKFGMGFLREIDKTAAVPVAGVPGKTENVGLQMAVRLLVAGDPVTLVEVLDLANKTEKPRVTRTELDSYVEDESTDIEKLFEDVLDFLKQSNATKKVATMILETKQKVKTTKE